MGLDLAKNTCLCFIIVINLSFPNSNFCIKKYIKTQGEVCRQLKIFLTPGSFATYRSKTMVPALFLFCVALWFILRGSSGFSLPVLFVLFFFFFFYSF